MDKISRINAKLTELEVIGLEQLDAKTISRIENIEEHMMELEDKAQNLLVQLKILSPTISSITQSKNINISRKTAYNDVFLKDYIDLCIKNYPDYLNEKALIKSKNENTELSELYNKVIDNIIDQYNVEAQKKELLEEIETLKHMNDGLREIINEKNAEINHLKQEHKVIEFKKERGK